MKTVNRLLAGVAAVAMMTAPVAAADFGYDMGLEQDAKTYGGLYYAIPFQGGTDRETREGTTLGFQLDHKTGTSLDPFDAPVGFEQKAMFDVSFDSNFTLNKMLVNGIDTVAMYDQLHADGVNEDERGIMTIAMIGVAAIGIIWAIGRGGDNKHGDACASEGGEGGKGDMTFTDVRYFEGGGTYSCEDDNPKYEDE